MSTDGIPSSHDQSEIPQPSPAIIDEIRAVDLPRRVRSTVEEYDRIIGERDEFLWKWIYSLFDAFTLSSVPAARFEHVRTEKTLFTIFITVFDDLIEKHGDRATFSAARLVPFRRWEIDRHSAGDIDGDVLSFVSDIWVDIQSSLRKAPRYRSFSELFQFDLRQSFTAMEYTQLVNDNLYLANRKGADHYAPHNMVLFPYTDIDLMHSPSFGDGDLAPLRTLTWDLQKLARIGNWLTTWQRELRESDYSAGVVIRAIRDGIVDPEELDEPSDHQVSEIITRIRSSGLPDALMTEWVQGFQSVKGHDFAAQSVDLDDFVDGMETVMEYHLASQGFK